ncbi:MAG TPA: alpha/beta hydrolase [Caulobacteraceae bacterium]|jgi:pimeloyl-ACP methyl ester carboxylesterase
MIMVHGAFCGGWCFDRFRRPFETAGYAVSAPDLPGHGERRSEGVAGLSVRRYAQDIVEQVRACPEPPILLGHSMGGLVASMAAAQTRVRALIMLAPSPPWGVVGSAMEVAAAVGLSSEGAYWSREIPPDGQIMSSVSLDRTPRREHPRIIAQMGPESGRALYEIINWWADPTMASMVPPGGSRAPSLVIGGGNDRIHPTSTIAQIALRTGAEMRTMDGMSHWLIGEPGWRDVARACLDWLAVQARAAA